ncbi:MAG: GntR family transcriptional regulator [Vulcanimicrobiaceae bacterium]
MADKSIVHNGVYISPTGGPAIKQILQRVRMLVVIGAWREGERVPSAEALAASLGVAENTVRSAYVRLMRAGVLIGEPPIGTSVAIGARSSALLGEVIRDSLSEAVAWVWSLGVPRTLLEKILSEIIAAQYERKADGREEDDG